MPAENDCRKFVGVPALFPEELLEEPDGVVPDELIPEEELPGTGRFFAEATNPPPPHAMLELRAARRMRTYKCINFTKLT